MDAGTSWKNKRQELKFHEWIVEESAGREIPAIDPKHVKLRPTQTSQKYDSEVRRDRQTI